MTVRALRAAVGLLLKNPTSLLLAYAISLLAAAPLAALMVRTLSTTAGDGYPAPLGRGAIDVSWWQRMQQQDASLATEFLPRTLGFSAAVDNLSALLDGPRWHVAAVLAAASVHTVMWAMVWGLVLTRFAGTRRAGVTHWGAVLRRFTLPMLAVSAAAASVGLVLYVTLRPLLLEGLFPLLLAGADSRSALLMRAALYLMFGACLFALSGFADLARSHAVLRDERSFQANAIGALRTLRHQWGAVAGIGAVMIALHVILLLGYGAGELLGGARVGGWRAVAAAQLFVVGRVLLRLFWAGSLLKLAQHELRTTPR